MEKICLICGEKKSVKDFYKNGTRLHAYCKLCDNKRCQSFRRTKKGLVLKIYSAQKTKSKKRGHDAPNYCVSELMDWAYSQPIFHELYSEWVASDYNKDFTPSFDRKDDYKPYTLRNLQIMTWRENNMKGSSDIVNGINNKLNHAVRGIHIESGEIKEFYSIRDAGRKTNSSFGNIHNCLTGRAKSAKGYKWELIKN
jgi:hypothetical protein